MRKQRECGNETDLSGLFKQPLEQDLLPLLPFAAAEATVKVKKLSTQRGVYVICGCLITHTAAAAAAPLPPLPPLPVTAVCLSV